MSTVLLYDGDILKGKPWFNSHLGYWMHGDDEYIHRTVAEKALGRKLTTEEVVHHVNYDKNDNRNANLLICDQTYHRMIHQRWDAMLAGFDWQTHSLCSVCKTYHPLEDFAKSAKRTKGVHNICKEQSNRIRREKQYNKGKFDWKARMNQQYRRALKKGSVYAIPLEEGNVHA